MEKKYCVCGEPLTSVAIRLKVELCPDCWTDRFNGKVQEEPPTPDSPVDLLVNCPFCGSDKVEYYNGWQFGDRKKHIEKTRNKKDSREPTICCHRCGIGFNAATFGYGVSDEDAESETKKRWNKRSS